MKSRTLLLAAAAAVALSGCQVMSAAFCGGGCRPETRASSSLVGFLYPNGETPPRDNRIPQLTLPARVGLAFLPAQPGLNSAAGLDAAHREALLDRIRERFAGRRFVGEITIIPDYYLNSGRGFEGLAAVQRLYDVDVLALVSYDQVTYHDDNSWSLGYLTIVGAYVLKGTRHDVTTLVDLAVVDPATRSILLRAGGTDQRHGTTTLVAEDRESREARVESFEGATDHLIQNFDVALTRFESEVRAGKANVRVAHRNGQGNGQGNGNGGGGGGGGGGGALDAIGLAALAAILAGSLLYRRRVRSNMLPT